MRRLFVLGAAAGLTAVAACSDNSANSFDPIGAPVYGVSQIVAGTNTPRGTATFVFGRTPVDSSRDSVRLTLQGLDTLESGFYTVWLGDSLNAAFKRAPGTLVRIRTDTSTNAQGDPVVRVDTAALGTAISAFKNGGPRSRFVFTTTRAQAGLTNANPMQVVLLTVESSNTATTPAARRRFLWARRGDLTLTTGATSSTRSGNLRFGNMGIRADSDYVYIPTGRGRVYVRGNLLQVEDSSLTRPPFGYFYGVYGVRRDTANKVVDTLYFGPLMSPYPRRSLSLREADSLIVDPEVQPTSPQAILAASVRIMADTVAKLSANGTTPFKGLAQLFVTLESKSKPDTRLGPATILTVDLPGIVRTPPAQ